MCKQPQQQPDTTEICELQKFYDRCQNLLNNKSSSKSDENSCSEEEENAYQDLTDEELAHPDQSQDDESENTIKYPEQQDAATGKYNFNFKIPEKMGLKTVTENLTSQMLFFKLPKPFNKKLNCMSQDQILISHLKKGIGGGGQNLDAATRPEPKTA